MAFEQTPQVLQTSYTHTPLLHQCINWWCVHLKAAQPNHVVALTWCLLLYYHQTLHPNPTEVKQRDGHNSQTPGGNTLAVIHLTAGRFGRHAAFLFLCARYLLSALACLLMLVPTYGVAGNKETRAPFTSWVCLVSWFSSLG